jgi:hypothetical protein
METAERAKIGDGQLVALRAMLDEHIKRKGEASSFSMRAGLLASVLAELSESRP